MYFRPHRLWSLVFFAITLLVAPAAKAVPADVDFDNKGLQIRSQDKNHLLTVNFLLVPQYQYLSIGHQGETSTFQVRRARLYFSGNAFSPDLTYRLETEVVGGRAFTVSPGATFRGPNLKDAFIDYNFGHGFQVQAGQYKVYFNREELTSTSQLQFVDLSLTNEVFSYHRDLGVALHGYFKEPKMEYAVYGMNDGSNENTQNKNSHFLFGFRVLHDILGKHGLTMADIHYSESDILHSDEPRLAVALASTVNRVRATQVRPDVWASASTADVAYRYSGFSGMGIGYHFINLNTSDHTFGFLGQAGYFLIPTHLEVAARYAGVIPTSQTVSNGYEVGGCINYFFHGHRLKLQGDYDVLINSPLAYGAGGASGVALPGNIAVTGGTPGFHAGRHDHQVRLQLQLFL